MHLSALTAAIVGAAALGLSAASGQPPPDKRLEDLLKDSRIWGTNFAEVLASMPAWKDSGEQRIVVYRNRVEGTREFNTNAEARNMESQTRVASLKARPTPAPAFKVLLGPVMARPITNQRASSVSSPGGESVRLAWVQPRQLLAPDLTKAKLAQAQGEPERVTRRLIKTNDERRPVVLTELHYANGSVVFAQPDYAPRPGFIDRVSLNTARITETVFAK